MIKPASRMFLCHKGYDCSETSELVTEHCFGSMDELNFVAEEIHPQACGLDVNTFYNDHFLTVNQAEDVQALFNVMVNHYAQ